MINLFFHTKVSYHSTAVPDGIYGVQIKQEARLDGGVQSFQKRCRNTQPDGICGVQIKQEVGLDGGVQSFQKRWCSR